jgi:hypothetical protein
VNPALNTLIEQLTQARDTASRVMDDDAMWAEDVPVEKLWDSLGDALWYARFIRGDFAQLDN